MVRDHSHVTGRYRGSAPQSCNLNFKVTKKIPVVFHNLRGYDGHLIMQQIGRVCKERSWVDEKGKKHQMNVNVIPNGMEKYTAFTMGQRLVFIDSFQFMSSSLASLTKSLATTDFKHLTHKFGERTELMKRKGVYPYEYTDSFGRYEEDCLPDQSKYFSSLTGEGITDEDYDHAKEVWKAFGMRNMGDYHDHYMAADVLLLADIFESFRSNCLKNYGLDPCHYFSCPGMAWDAMLTMTGIKLELISDVDKYLFVEKGIRGGISFIGKRYSYNPGQNYVGQACRMHCLDHRSVFHMETSVIWAKSYFPPSPHAMLFVRKGLPTSRPTLHRGGGGRGGGGGKGGASENCSNSGKRHFVPHILARILGK